MFFDPVYLLFMVPGLLISLWAQARVQSAFNAGRRMRTRSGLSGAEAAERILANHGLSQISIERAGGFLGDHYDPRTKTLRLSRDVFEGRSVASVGVAAHEAGHALQDQSHYAPLKIRNGIVPLATLGTHLCWILLIVGFILHSFNLVVLGLALFSVFVFFQLVTLPVEFDASARAKKLLVSDGIISADEAPAVARVLNAAALTYVAAALTAILQLLYFLFRSGILGGRR